MARAEPPRACATALGGVRRPGRPGFRLGWGRFPDGAAVLSLDDRDDGGFGYAGNLTVPECSEWG